VRRKKFTLIQARPQEFCTFAHYAPACNASSTDWWVSMQGSGTPEMEVTQHGACHFERRSSKKYARAAFDTLLGLMLKGLVCTRLMQDTSI
jgi:hypothetical protein